MPSEEQPSSQEHGAERPSGLENLERRLYSRKPPPLLRGVDGIATGETARIRTSWTDDKEKEPSFIMSASHLVMSWLMRVLVASVVFFLAAALIAVLAFWRGGNVVSERNVILDVSGPIGVAAGAEATYEIRVRNKNSVMLNSVDVLVEFPEGTRRPDDLAAELRRTREALGDIPSGEERLVAVSAALFGEEGERKTLRIATEYRASGSNLVLLSERMFETLITAAPLALFVDAPGEVSSRQPFEFAIELVANAQVVVQDVLLKAEYPFSFVFEGAEPEPHFADSLWQLGDLSPGARRLVRIRGELSSQDEAEKTFRFSVGTASPRDEKDIGTVLATDAPALLVTRPGIGIEFVVNGERGETYVAKGGEPLRGDIIWKNNLPVRVTDVEITARLDGRILDFASVAPERGFFDSNSRTVRWDKRELAALAVVEPGGEGNVSFAFAPLAVSSNPTSFENPEIRAFVSARAKRLDEAGATQEVFSSAKKEIPFTSTFNLLARLLARGAPFQSAGPLPPRAGEETTYTVVWSLANSTNELSAVSVSAVLPSYVRWMGRWHPPEERVSYNAIGGEVLWEIPALAPGVGFGRSPRELSFQVSVLPSTSQIGTAPVIVGETAAEGFDRFARVKIRSNARPALSTESVPPGDAGRVAE